MKEYLPPVLQDHLVVNITEFIYNPWKAALTSRWQGASQGGSQAAADARGAEEVQVGPWG